MSNEIKLTFAGDAKSLERSFADVGKAADGMTKDLDSANDGANRFARGIGGMNEKVDASESKFMGTADLLDGLSTTLGIDTHGAIDMARGFGDLAGGFAQTVGPALEGLSGKLGHLSVFTKAQSVAQAALNGIMSANPIFLVVAAIAALAIGFVIAYKKSETFRNLVNGAFSSVTAGAKAVAKTFTDGFHAMTDVAVDAGHKIAKVADIITLPYQLAFKAIAHMWNATVGKLHVSIPGFLGFGGISFDVPDIPEGFARGGRTGTDPIMVGERGPEMFVPGMTGSVVPNNALGGGGVTVLIAPGGDAAYKAWIRSMVRIESGGDAQAFFGAA